MWLLELVLDQAHWGALGWTIAFGVLIVFLVVLLVALIVMVDRGSDRRAPDQRPSRSFWVITGSGNRR